MRTRNSLKNTIFSLAGYALTFAFGLLVRRLFLDNLSFENLGYEGLFNNLFNVLFTADLGVGALFTYRFYAALANRDEAEIARLCAMFRRLMRLLLAFALAVGCALMPLLPLMIKDEISDWGYVYIVYALQYLTFASGYIFIANRTLLVADQKGYTVTKIETIVRLFVQALKVVVLIVYKNYLVYASVTILYNLLSGFVITLICKNQYAYAFRRVSTREDFQREGLLAEIKDAGANRLLSAVYYATDSILISMLLGIRTVALYGNYTLISTNVNTVFSNVLQPVSASIGNYVNTERPEDSYKLFSAVDLLSYFCAAFAMIAYAVLFQPAITVLFGAEYLLDSGFVLLFSLYSYLFIKALGLNAFRGTFGRYGEERAYLIAAAVVNIAVSILACRRMGIAGIMLGTVLSMMIMWAGKSVLTFRHCFQARGLGYMARQAGRLLLAVSEMLLLFRLCETFPLTAGGLLLRALLCLIAPNALHLALYWRTGAFAILRGYAKKMLAIIKKPGDADGDAV